MGHIVNPVGFRVGRSVSWRARWTGCSYSQSLQRSMLLVEYFKMVVKKMPLALLFSHVRWLGCSVFVFVYSPNLVYLKKPRLLYSFIRKARRFYWVTRAFKRFKRMYFPSARLRKKKYLKSYITPTHFKFTRLTLPFFKRLMQRSKKVKFRKGDFFSYQYNDVEEKEKIRQKLKVKNAEKSARYSQVKLFTKKFKPRFKKEQRGKFPFRNRRFQPSFFKKMGGGKPSKFLYKQKEIVERKGIATRGKKGVIAYKEKRYDKKQVRSLKKGGRKKMVTNQPSRARTVRFYSTQKRKNSLAFILNRVRQKKVKCKPKLKSKLKSKHKRSYTPKVKKYKKRPMLPISAFAKKGGRGYKRPRAFIKYKFKKIFRRIYKRILKRKWFLRKRGSSYKRVILKRGSYRFLRMFFKYRLRTKNAKVLPTRRITLRVRRKKGIWRKSIKQRSFFGLLLRKNLLKYFTLRLKKRWKFVGKGAALTTRQQLSAYRNRIPFSHVRRRLKKTKRVFFSRPFHYYKPIVRGLRVAPIINYGKAVFPVKSLQLNFLANYYDFFKEKSKDYTGRRKLVRRFFKMRAWQYHKYDFNVFVRA